MTEGESNKGGGRKKRYKVFAMKCEENTIWKT
jgi:hypothetical protein